MMKTKVRMDKPVYLELSILELSKTLMYVEKRFDTLNYEVNRSWSIGKNKKVTELMKDELGGKIIKDFLGIRPNTYSYLADDDNNAIIEQKE